MLRGREVWVENEGEREREMRDGEYFIQMHIYIRIHGFYCHLHGPVTIEERACEIRAYVCFFFVFAHDLNVHSRTQRSYHSIRCLSTDVPRTFRQSLPVQRQSISNCSCFSQKSISWLWRFFLGEKTRNKAVKINRIGVCRIYLK